MDAQMQARRGHGVRPAQGACRRRVRAALPAGRQSRDRRDQRLRGPDPLAPSREGADPAGHLHSAGRGDRLHRPARRVGAPAGLRHGRAAGRTTSRSRSTSRPCSSATRAWCRSWSARWPRPGLAADRLELEITETALLQDSEATLATLYQLRELGVRIAMDDFGTGYSSLSYLQSFPFDKIKIDRSFVKDIADGVGSLNIVRAVAAHGQRARHDDDGGRRRDQEQLETVQAGGLHRDAGLPVQPAAAGARDRAAVAGKRRATARASAPAGAA